MLVQFFEGQEPLYEDLPNKKLYMIEDCEWHIAFDSPSIQRGGGTGLVLYVDGTDVYS